MRILWVPDRQVVDLGVATRFWWGGGLMEKRAWTAEDWQAFRASPKREVKEELVSPETDQGRQAADRTILTALGFHAEQFGEYATEASLLRLMKRTLIDIRTIPALRKYLHGMAERSLVSQAGYGRWEAV